MPDEKKRRRRRGRRGGQGRAPGEASGEAQGEQPEAPSDNERPSEAGARALRRDTRRGRGGTAPSAGGPPSPTNPSIRRAPSAGDRGRQRGDRPDRGERGERSDRGERGRPQRDGRDGRERPRRDNGARAFEAPPPPDPLSIELGQKFRETQTAVRDARKALDKRRAEFNDEPEWMLAQLHEAESRFEEASTAWVEHLSKTGRKMARR